MGNVCGRGRRNVLTFEHVVIFNLNMNPLIPRLYLQLKKEVSDLTLQRDLAQSQIKDMLQVVGDDLSSTELVSVFDYLKTFKVVHGIQF